MSRLRDRIYKDYRLNELKYDFLGYLFDDKRDLSLHHIVPKHSGGTTKKDNLCLLCRDTSHNYIHLIEDYDYNIFIKISDLLFRELRCGYIDVDSLKRIEELLLLFEYKYKDEQSRNGNPIIKTEYKTKRLKSNI